MNAIVYKTSKGTPVTNSLLVAEKFEKNHKDVLRAIENLTAQNCATKFYHKSTYTNRGKEYPMYLMTRDGFSLLVMGFTGEMALNFKVSFIDAFNKMENELKTANAIPQSFYEALMLAANQQKEIETANKKLAIQAPKVELANRLIETDTRVDIGQACKLLKLPYGRNTFFKLLKERGIFFANRNEPKQEYISRGYFELFMVLVETKHHGDISKTKIIVTQKGLAWLAGQFDTTINDKLPTLSLS